MVGSARPCPGSPESLRERYLWRSTRRRSATGEGGTGNHIAGQNEGGGLELFEYLAIAFSLLYSVAALRVLGGLPSALAPGRRHPLHLTLMVTLLVLIATSFWVFWGLQAVTWTFQGYLIALLVPGFLHYCAVVLVPENPEQVDSWKDHYFAMHRRWYFGLALWGLAAGASATVNLGMPIAHPARIVHVTAIALGMMGALSSSRRVHTVLVAVIATLSIGTLIGQVDPDWLARR